VSIVCSQPHRVILLFLIALPIYSAFVNHPLLDKFDLSSIVGCGSGAAPLPVEVIKQFEEKTGAVIFEGYGLTETSPVITLNPTNPDQRKIGSVGMPFLSVDIKIVDLETGLQELPRGEDGEIAASGPQVMLGYWNKPGADGEVFREIDGKRYFLTGDIGHFDEDGFLIITDRKKDLIVTAGGKNIAPQHLENLLKKDEYISEVMLYGDKQRFISALVVPDFENLERYALSHDILYTDMRGLLEDPEIIRLYEQRFRKVHEENEIPGYEQVKKFILLDSDFSMDDEEVTPTMKLRRKIVTAKYQQQLDALYEE
jgi:long-chain acyl-CoA synthetase